MSLQIETVSRACQAITKEIKNSYKNLTVFYIVHHEGERQDALNDAIHQLSSHPAKATAQHILQRVPRNEESAVLGTAVARQHVFLGLATVDTVLTICTINLEQFQDIKAARRHAYHQAWHAIDAYKYHANPENRTGASTEVIVRRRNVLDLGLSNLKADVFAAITTSLRGDFEAIDKISYWRGVEAMERRSLHDPERYPFAIAKAATKFAFDQIRNKSVPQKRIIPIAFKLSNDVGETFDDVSLRNWVSFSNPAQDMAWRGFGYDSILGAAIYTSPDSNVRATGHLVSEITGVKPVEISAIEHGYSPFADVEYNKTIHKKAISRIFEDVIAQGLQVNSSRPFIEKANSQNEALSEGHVIGWCGTALQKAGEAYQDALDKGETSPENAARQKFDGSRELVAWESLHELGKKVVKIKRGGDFISLASLKHLASEDGNLGEVADSIGRTMSDPCYQKELAVANELAHSKAPKGLAKKVELGPAAPGPRGPAPAAGPAAPAAPGGAGLPGLGGRSRHVHVQQQYTEEQPPAQQKQAQQQQGQPQQNTEASEDREKGGS